MIEKALGNELIVTVVVGLAYILLNFFCSQLRYLHSFVLDVVSTLRLRHAALSFHPRTKLFLMLSLTHTSIDALAFKLRGSCTLVHHPCRMN